LALQIQDAKIFQERALSALLDQNPGSREAGEWSPSRLYLLLPLQSHDLDDNPHPPVDWECVKKLISDPMFVEDQDCLNEPTSLQTDWSSSSFSLHTCTVQLANGRFPVEAILDSVVETTHSREAGPSLFCGCELILDLNANSPMRNQGIKKNFSCYAQYFSEKHSVQLVHRNQPMLNATRLIGVQNLLTPRTIGSQGQTLDTMDTTDCLQRTVSMGFFPLVLNSIPPPRGDALEDMLFSGFFCS
jgi:hypothetical protein